VKVKLRVASGGPAPGGALGGSSPVLKRSLALSFWGDGPGIARHYSATQLVSAGVDIRTVAGRLGHGSGGATTLRTYAAWSPDADRRAALTIAGIVPTPDAANRQPRAAYELLAADLAAAIVCGVLEPGTQLPTLVELGAANNMAPNTAARALAILKERGLVTVVRGQRARVVGPQVATPS